MDLIIPKVFLHPGGAGSKIYLPRRSLQVDFFFPKVSADLSGNLQRFNFPEGL